MVFCEEKKSRRVKFPFQINSNVVSVYVRSTGEFRSLERANATHREQVSRGVLFYQSRRLIKSIHQGGVPFNQCEQSEPSRTRRKGRENTKTAIFISMCDYLYSEG